MGRIAHLVGSGYVETFKVDEKVLLPDSPALFSTFDYPRDTNNKGLWLAHESAKKGWKLKT
jgi:hypothetical protein